MPTPQNLLVSRDFHTHSHDQIIFSVDPQAAERAPFSDIGGGRVSLQYFHCFLITIYSVVIMLCFHTVSSIVPCEGGPYYRL